MKDEHEREIVQLWWTAQECFALAEQVKRNLSEGQLQTTVQQLADRCQHMSDIKDTNALLTLLSAHLGSCAVRLYSIDEQRKGCSPRWQAYRELEKKGDLLTDTEVKQELSSVVHFLLRHNVAHAEDEVSKEHAYPKMQCAFRCLTIKQLYENILTVKGSVEKDVELIIK